MSKKYILILSPFFPPRNGAGVYRWAKFCKYLNEYGWDSLIITAPIFDSDKLDLSLWDEVKDKVEIIYPSHYPACQSSWWSRENNSILGYLLKGILNNSFFIPDCFIRYLPSFVSAGIRACRNKEIHAIVATGSPFSTFVAGALISKFTNVPLVLDFRDFWADDVFVKRKKLHVRVIIQLMEAWSVRHSRAVISVTEDMTKVLNQKYKTCSYVKFFTITNGYDEDDFTFSNTYLTDEYLVFCHVGTWNAAHPLENFLKALKLTFSRLPEMTDRIRIVLCGQISNNNQTFINQMDLSNSVILRGQVSHTEAIDAMANSHIQILSMANLDMYSTYFSGKIFEYLRTGKEILGLVPDGLAATLIRELKAGTIVNPDDTEFISSVIIDYYKSFSSGLPIGASKDANYMSKITIYSRRYLTSTLSNILDNVSH